MGQSTFDDKLTLNQVIALCCQAISWINVDADLCHCMALLGHNELKYCIGAVLTLVLNYICNSLNICIIDTFFCSDMPGIHELTHWGREMYICVSELTSIGSDNGLSPGRRQAIIWTDAGILSIRTKEQTSVKFQSQFKHFISRKCVWKCRLENVGHFVSVSMCLEPFPCWTCLAYWFVVYWMGLVWWSSKLMKKTLVLIIVQGVRIHTLINVLLINVRIHPLINVLFEGWPSLHQSLAITQSKHRCQMKAFSNALWATFYSHLTPLSILFLCMNIGVDKMLLKRFW